MLSSREGEIGRDRDRIVNLSDGVFAIAITLLILDIRVPDIPENMMSSQLPGALLSLWPKYLGYILSFVGISAFWLIHHSIFRSIGSYDRILLYLNHLVPSARHRILGCNNASSFCGSGERSLAWPCSLAPHCSPLVGAWRRWISPLRAHLVSVEEYGISVPQPVKTPGRVAPRCASFSRARTSGRLHRWCAIWRKALSTSDS